MKLFACSTYYHALIACVKQLVCRSEADVLITEYIPEGAALARRIEESGLFRRTVYVGDVREYVSPNIADYILIYHRKNATVIARQLPAGFRFEDYDKVNIFHDDTWMAHYLKDRRLPYRLMEDALDSYKVLSVGPFAHMLPQKGLKPLVKRLFHIGYLFFGEDSLAREIEVNDSDGVEIPRKRLKVIPRKPLFDALTAEDIETLKRIFAKDIPPVGSEKTALVLTQPLYMDGFLPSEEEQIALYRRLADECLNGWKLVIKAHPRDFTDYSKAFPEAVILDKNMPSEMLTYVLPCEFAPFTPFPGLPNCKRTGGYMKISVKG